MRDPIAEEDLYRFRWVDHVRLSPGRDRVAYQVTWADPDARENRGCVWVQGLGGDPAAAVAGSGRLDQAPEWSPDGSMIAFLGRTGARPQLYAAAAAGGGSQQLTDFPDGVTDLRWSPDGAWIAFTAMVVDDPDAVVEDPRPPESADQSRRPPIARIARRLDYKHDGSGYADGRHAHLFLIPAGGGEARRLTGGAWAVEGFAWAPDGRRLVITGDDEPEADRRRENRLYVVDLEGRRRPIARGRKFSSPAWSPAGDLIAFLAPTHLDAGRHERVWVMPAEGGEARCLTTAFDRACDGGVISDMRAGHSAPLIWTEDGARLLFLASGPGVAEVFSVGLDGATRVELAAGRRAVVEFDARGGVLAACVTDPAQPGEVVVADGGGERFVTDLNPWLRDRDLAAMERHLFEAPDGQTLEGWLIRPPEMPRSGRCPLVLQVHGGPHGQYGWAFFHEFQVLAGRGIAVLAVNPRGSDGYGEEFKRAVVHDWAGRDHDDLMAALDQLLERCEFVDRNRLGVAGGSYGGYMTNWIVGHTDRFRAAVAMRSISNLVSDYAQHDIAPWFELELGPADWTSPDELWRRSPIRYVEQIRTPLLLVHSEMDLRCPMSQAEELFGALRMLGRSVELVRFPGESHDLSRNGRPDRRVERLRRITGWFEAHLSEAAETTPSRD